MLLGRRVVEVSPSTHQVIVVDGTRYHYKKLIWAAGGAARKINCEGANSKGVHTIRNRADIDLLMKELEVASNVVIIGGGYIGLEAAAAIFDYRKSITVLEAQDRVLARVAGEPLSRFFEAEHQSRGTDIRLSVAIRSICHRNGKVTGVELDNAEVIPADIVIVGIGIVPSVQPLINAGAEGGNGLAVDMYCRTSLADIFAIGDCALHRNRFAPGAPIRLESVQNANDQAIVAGSVIAGQPQTYTAVPWFWSNQFDLKLQTVGLSLGYDQVVVRGLLSERSFSVIYLRNGKIIALDCVNATKDYVQGKEWVVNGLSALASDLADTSVSLKELAARSPVAV